MKLSRSWSTVAFCAFVMRASEAQAHSPIKGLGTFYSHFLDPLVVPAHALVLIATALMLGLQGRARARTGLIAFIACFAGGLAASSAGMHVANAEQALLIAAAAIGASVSLDRQAPLAITVAAAAAAGLLIGLDCEADGATARERALVLAGLGAGVLYFIIVIAGLTVLQTRAWVRIGVRVAGSWIVAASMMVLALSVAQHAKRMKTTSAIVVERTAPC